MAMKPILLAILLWPSLATAQDAIGEAEKTAALREAYRIAGPGASWGMVDIGVTIVPRTPPDPVTGVVRNIPIKVEKPVAEKPMKVAEAAPVEQNVCTRHGKRKVVTGTNWHGRK